MKDSKVKRIISKIPIILLIIILIYNIIFVIGHEINKKFNIVFFGKQAITVEETSIKEEITSKDIIIIKETNEIGENDIIAFYDKDTLRIRRVVQIKNEYSSKKYITKGDNYLYNDPAELTASKIEGKVIKVVKNLGFVLKILQSKILMIINTIILLVILYRNKKLEEKRKVRRKEKLDTKKTQ